MALNIDEIYKRLQLENLILLFDTSVTTRNGFLRICEQIQRINVKQRAKGLNRHIELKIPAVAHTERLFDLAQEHQDKYNIEFIRTILSNHEIDVLNFTQLEAEHCAELLIQKYKTPTDWQAFKKRRCLECVGLPHDYSKAQGNGKRCGAPNDWLIIAQAYHEAMILVIDDKGKHQEFSKVKQIASSSDLETATHRLLSELI